MPVPPFPPPPATSGTDGGWRPDVPNAEEAQPPVVPAPALPAWPAPGNVTAPESVAHAPAAHPRQSAGTVYGGPPGQVTAALPTAADAVENSGSLTGHILAQGWPDTIPAKSHTTRVVAVLVVGLGIVVAVGLLMVFAIGDVFGALFEGLLNG